MKAYEFTQTITVPDARRADVAGAGPVYGPRAFAAGDRVPADAVHPGCLASLVRLGQVREVEPDDRPGLVELPAEPPAAEEQAPVPPADPPAKGKKK